MAKFLVKLLTLKDLKTENEKWGPLVAQIFAQLKVKIAHEEMHVEPQRSFIINALHAVAVIGNYALENDWDTEDTYQACMEVIKELAQKGGYLPKYLH